MCGIDTAWVVGTDPIPGGYDIFYWKGDTLIQKLKISLPDDEKYLEANAAVVAPLVLFQELLIGSVLIGMNELYIEKGTTLGAKPFTDYWGVILWGLSADVASRSLTEKQGT